MLIVRTWKSDGSQNLFRDARYAVANLHSRWEGRPKPSGDEIAARLRAGEILETHCALFHDPSVVTAGQVERARQLCRKKNRVA